MIDRKKAYFELSDKIALDDITDGFWECNLTTDETYLSPKWKQNLGYMEYEIDNKVDAWKSLIHPDDKEYVLSIHKLYLEKKIPKLEVKYRMRSKNGLYKFTLSRGKAIWDSVGNPIYIGGTHTDITEHMETYNDLKESEEKYSKLIELSPDSIVISDNKEILFINHAGVELLGFENKSELLGRELTSFALPEYQTIFNDRIKQMKKEDNSKRTEIQLYKRDGTVVDVEIASTELVHKEKKATLDIIRDISKRKESEIQIQKMMEENKRLLEETLEYDRLKTEFFSTISHELKTPLNIILSAMQLLDFDHCKVKECKNKGKMDKYIAMSKQNCYRLLRLINNLIDITKLDSGFMRMNLKNYNIVNVIENITLSVVEYALEKGIDLIFDTETEEKIMACDADKIERVMLNLLSNAIKFTESGGSIRVNLFDMGDRIKVVIKDTGIGIPKDKLKLIFDRFRQVDGTFIRRQEGSGIGLSLVKALVESHGGSIIVKSEERKGSEFTIELPSTVVKGDIKEDELNTTKSANVERINIEFSDIYS